MSEEIVGYFVWRRGPKGIPQPMKVDAMIRSGAQPVTIKEREEDEIKVHPLTAVGWAMSFNDLIILYPAPTQGA